MAVSMMFYPILARFSTHFLPLTCLIHCVQDGNATIVQAASVSLHGPHGQHIENVHLLPYASDTDFWDRLYCGPYARLLQTAEAFLNDDKDSGEAMLFIRWD